MPKGVTKAGKALFNFLANTPRPLPGSAAKDLKKVQQTIDKAMKKRPARRK